jgi:hypothetical protein
MMRCYELRSKRGCRFQPFGGGSGSECSGFGRATARNFTGGDFQLKGIGNGTTQGVNMLSPSALRTSKTTPGRAILVHSSHCAIAIHSLMFRLQSPSLDHRFHH